MRYKIYNLRFTESKQGYIALTTVLILGAIGMLLVTSSLLIGTIQSQTVVSVINSFRSESYANGCAEEALKEIRLSTPYSGTDTLSFSNGSCNYSVINTGGQDRRIEASGVSSGSTKRVLITIDSINPDINISSWQEVANF